MITSIFHNCESGRSPGEGISYPLQYSWASLVAQLVKNPPAMWETWLWSLGWEERLPTPVFWPGESHGLYSPWGRKLSDMTEWLSLHFTSIIVTASFQMPSTQSWKEGSSCTSWNRRQKMTTDRDVLMELSLTQKWKIHFRNIKFWKSKNYDSIPVCYSSMILIKYTNLKKTWN